MQFESLKYCHFACRHLEFAQELIESSSRYAYYFRISINLLFEKPYKLFALVFCLFKVFDDLSAAMK